MVCGTGNNGGDGLVVARHLLVRDAHVTVFLAGEVDRVSEDARANLDAWRGLGGELRTVASGESLASLADALARTEVVVDALFGTGLARPIEGFFADVVRAVNEAPALRFAIDLPSGLDADTGAELGVVVCAGHTVTFAHPKLGLLTPRGALRGGHVHVVDIGVPSGLASRLNPCAQLLEESDVATYMNARAPGAYKTSAGHVAVLGGSLGRIGAPQLVARGAARGGAGLVTIATWPESASAIESHILESMTARLDTSDLGKSLDGVLLGKNAAVIGPGFGLGPDARAAVEHVLSSFGGPLVIDADALTMFAGQLRGLARAKGPSILTPHPGEAARLLGRSAAEIEGDRFGAARDLAAATGAVVVLKGAHTVIATGERVAVSPISCPALATAGAGDVLGGVVAAMACSLEPFEAACAAVMLHGMAGQSWSRAHGGADRGLLASEIAEVLPSLFVR